MKKVDPNTVLTLKACLLQNLNINDGKMLGCYFKDSLTFVFLSLLLQYAKINVFN